MSVLFWLDWALVIRSNPQCLIHNLNRLNMLELFSKRRGCFRGVGKRRTTLHEVVNQWLQHGGINSHAVHQHSGTSSCDPGMKQKLAKIQFDAVRPLEGPHVCPILVLRVTPCVMAQ